MVPGNFSFLFLSSLTCTFDRPDLCGPPETPMFSGFEPSHSAQWLPGCAEGGWVGGKPSLPGVACSALGGSRSGGAPRVALLGRGSSFPLPPPARRETHTMLLLKPLASARAANLRRSRHAAGAGGAHPLLPILPISPHISPYLPISPDLCVLHCRFFLGGASGLALACLLTVSLSLGRRSFFADHRSPNGGVQ